MFREAPFLAYRQHRRADKCRSTAKKDNPLETASIRGAYRRFPRERSLIHSGVPLLNRA